ncbi:MAG TPA: zinc ribbon domain-containing protein [Pyrinomonadaceae bacterium]|nr:zinc ribbon domain-containing protein [Pyrinomonadaceae bacterium]
MFCPKCATQNVDGASYCRNCGANVRLVPQALNGQLPAAYQEDSNRYLNRRAPSVDRAVRPLMMGIAFAVVVAMTARFAPAATHWSFWLVIPAMLMFGRGFVELLRVRTARNQIQTPMQAGLNSARPFDLPSAKTEELITAVPSVTEGTTRHLENEAQTRQL